MARKFSAAFRANMGKGKKKKGGKKRGKKGMPAFLKRKLGK
jgi:hypothetical protein